MRTAQQNPQETTMFTFSADNCILWLILSQSFHLMMRHIMYVHYMMAMIMSIHKSYYNKKITLIIF